MISIETDIVIYRPIAEVYGIMADPNRVPEWSTGALEVRQVSGNKGQKGAVYTQLGRFLGRDVEMVYQITGAEPCKRFAIKTVSGPIPIEFEYRFQPLDGGTEVHATAESEPGGFFRLAEPLLAVAARRQMVAEFANLKDLIESGVLVTATA